MGKTSIFSIVSTCYKTIYSQLPTTINQSFSRQRSGVTVWNPLKECSWAVSTTIVRIRRLVFIKWNVIKKWLKYQWPPLFTGRMVRDIGNWLMTDKDYFTHAWIDSLDGLWEKCMPLVLSLHVRIVHWRFTIDWMMAAGNWNCLLVNGKAFGHLTK